MNRISLIAVLTPALLSGSAALAGCGSNQMKPQTVFKPPSRVPPPLEPAYPKNLKGEVFRATVKVLVKVDVAGNVTDVKIIKAGPHPEFDEAAATTARRQKWTPATKNGVAMPTTASYEYKFRLDDD